MNRNMWLLINNHVDIKLGPFTENYKLFDDPEKARLAAEEAGLYSMPMLGRFPLPQDMQIGVMQMFKQFPVDVSLIRLEIS